MLLSSKHGDVQDASVYAILLRLWVNSPGGKEGRMRTSVVVVVLGAAADVYQKPTSGAPRLVRCEHDPGAVGRPDGKLIAFLTGSF
jgi:hypothetical protein